MRLHHILNLLFQNNSFNKAWITFALCFNFFAEAQVANYVSNGSFEDCIACNGSNALFKARYWNSIDSISAGGLYFSSCPGFGTVPLNGTTYQYARTGLAFVQTDFFCQASFCNPSYNRFYLKNRLKSVLQNGTAYCVKFYVNISNNSTLGIDRFEAFFCNSSLDTITKCSMPLTYINPQISNPTNNIVTDTMNWTLITGTFTAAGSEKYMVIGNFKSDVATNTLLINPTYLPAKVTDVAVDDVSCIPLNLPAYAAPVLNIYAIPGNTIYLGRPSDVGIDEACMWYKFPNTTNAIDTIAGITVTVAATTETYMVKQDICGVVKYDTVIVHASGAGFSSLFTTDNSSQLLVSPNPAGNFFNVSLLGGHDNNPCMLYLFNSLGALVRKAEISFEKNNDQFSTEGLADGIYIVSVTNRNGFASHTKLVISK